MRLIRNAGAAVTGLLAVATAFACPPNQSAQALAAPTMPSEQVSDTPHRHYDTPHRHYSGLQEHFRAANVSNDGHLTLDQARQAGWNRIVRHFSDIDVAHSGFVTYDQIHAYTMSQRHRPRSPGEV